MNPAWDGAIRAADNQEMLQAILQYLEHQREIGALNNNGIPRMVRGYFCENGMRCRRLLAVLQPGGMMFMVNDNVRYAGAGVPVDLILSDLAETIGFEVEAILVLPQGKGNSSQQMGEHGRVPLRNCVYVWKKT